MTNPFKSKRVWIIIALVLVNGLTSVHEMLGATVVHWLDPILGLAGIYFGAKPSN